MKTREIYLVKSGLCCNDVIKSLKYYIEQNRELLKETKSNLLKLKNTPDYTLTENGIKEIINLKNNEKVKNIINTDIMVLSAFEKSCIESSMILFNNLKENTNYNGYIKPILNISVNNFKNLRDVEEFKRDFGISNNTSNKYWNNLSTNSELLEIKKDIPSIEWKDSSSSSLNDYNSYNFYKFEKYLINTIEKYSSNILIVANSKFIEEFLKKIRDKKYKFNKLKDIIEYSSCYKIVLELEKSTLGYKKFEKIYPTKFNYLPLKNDKDGTYSYRLKNELKLNNSMEYIKITELRKVFINRCIAEKIIKNIFKNNKENTNKNNNININNHKNDNSTHKNNLLKLIKKASDNNNNT